MSNKLCHFCQKILGRIMDEFPSKQILHFLKIFASFKVENSELLVLNEFNRENPTLVYEKFKSQMESINVDLSNTDPSYETFYLYILDKFDDFLRNFNRPLEERLISKEIFCEFVMGFTKLIVFNKQNSMSIKSICSKVEKIIRNHRNSKFISYFYRLYIICYVFILQFENTSTIQNIEDIINLSDYHCKILTKYLTLTKNPSFNFIQMFIFPNYISISNQTSSISSEIIMLPSLYALAYSGSIKTYEYEICKIFAMIRHFIYVFTVKETVEVEDYVLLSNFLSCGDLFRGCFCHYLSILLFSNRFFETVAKFFSKLHTKVGAAIFRQIFALNATLEISHLIMQRGEYFAQEAVVMQDYLDKETFTALAFNSEWEKLNINIFTRKFNPEKLMSQLFTIFIAILRLNSFDIDNLTEKIIPRLKPITSIIIEIMELSENIEIHYNPLAIKLLSNIFMQFYSIFQKISNDQLLSTDLIYEFLMKSLNLVFHANISPDFHAVQDAVIRQLGAGCHLLSKFNLMNRIAEEKNQKYLIVRGYLIHMLDIKPCPVVISSFMDLIQIESIMSYTIACKLMENIISNENGVSIFQNLLAIMSQAETQSVKLVQNEANIRILMRFLLALATGFKNAEDERISSSKIFDEVIDIMNEFLRKTNLTDKLVGPVANLLLVFSEKKGSILIRESVLIDFINNISRIDKYIADVTLQFEMLHWKIAKKPHDLNWNSIFCSKSSKLMEFVEEFNSTFKAEVDSAAVLIDDEIEFYPKLFWKQIPYEFCVFDNTIIQNPLVFTETVEEK